MSLCIAGYPAIAFAQASLFVSPASGSYKVGDLFSILLSVNSGGESINAASAQLNFDNQRLEVISLGYTRSVFSIWTEEPVFSNPAGTLRFSGGVPNPGFTGASGAIVRITFKAKEIGQAPLVFASGSVLANNGEGTNILDGLRGGLYSIAQAPPQAAKTSQTQTTPAPSPAPLETGIESVSAPIITEWPERLEEGDMLSVKGLGFPSGKVAVYFQKDFNDPHELQTVAEADGRFTAVMRQGVEAGYYRVWAKNINPDGTISASSDIITVKVVLPLLERIKADALNYVSLMVTLVSLLAFAIIMIFWSWAHFRKWRVRQSDEIVQAEQALHRGFDAIKENMSEYLSSVAESKSPTERKYREAAALKEMKKKINVIEKEIEKEIRDIKKQKKK